MNKAAFLEGALKTQFALFELPSIIRDLDALRPSSTRRLRMAEEPLAVPQLDDLNRRWNMIDAAPIASNGRLPGSGDHRVLNAVRSVEPPPGGSSRRIRSDWSSKREGKADSWLYTEWSM